MQSEVFHIYHLGEQRGPYTMHQINHLYRCEFIDEDTLYWREGMEQWAPVTQIVARRRKQMRFVRWSIWLGIIGVVAALVMLFGPVTADAWRELTRGAYTSEDAYWRARAMVREAVGKSVSVKFEPFSPADAVLTPPSGATVTISGTIGDSSGGRRDAWRVRLRHLPEQQDWVADSGEKETP